jgi:tetratricopeptide (TPR) repeat protein
MRELQVEPDPETRQLYEHLLKATQASGLTGIAPRRAEGAGRLVGRVREWQQILDAWHSANDGRSGLLLITGDAGIGKTRLADEALDWARRQGVVNASAHCYAAEGALAYAPVAAWLSAPSMRRRLEALDAVWANEITLVAPDLGGQPVEAQTRAIPDDGARRRRLFHGLARAAVAPAEPTLLMIDDLQWCDRDTLEWLHYLLRFEPTARMLVIATARDAEIDSSHPLHALISAAQREGLISEVALGPLSSDETAALASQTLETALGLDQTAGLFAETEGNPLFVVELARAGISLRDPAHSPREGSLAHKVARPLPPRIQAVLQARLSQVSPDARELACMAAAIGRDFAFPTLHGASDLSEGGLVRCLDELWQRRIIREHGNDAYDFTHDKLREAAYASLSAARRRYLHRRIAQALEAADGASQHRTIGQIALHYDLAGDTAQAIVGYKQAAVIAQKRFANAEAIRCLRRALELIEETEGRTAASTVDIAELLGDLLHFGGEYAQAAMIFERARAATPPSSAINGVRLLRKIGNTDREQRHYVEAYQAYSESRQLLSTIRDKSQIDWWREWIQTLLEMSGVLYWTARIEEADSLRVALNSVIEEHGTPEQITAHFQTSARIEFTRNRWVATPETTGWAEAALKASLLQHDTAGVPSAVFLVGFFRLWSGDPRGATAPLAEALGRAEETGDISLQARSLAYLTVADRQCGRVDDARRHAIHAFDIALAAKMPEYIAAARANLAWVAWRTGDYAQTLTLGEAALEQWRNAAANVPSSAFKWLAVFPLIAASLRTGSADSALAYARLLTDSTSQHLPDPLASLIDAAMACVAGGAPDAARIPLEQAVETAHALGYL